MSTAVRTLGARIALAQATLSQALAGTAAGGKPFPSKVAQAAAIRAASAPDSIILVSSATNNVHVTVSDLQGNVVARSSGGMVGFKHRARATPIASSKCAQQAAQKAVALGHLVAHLQLRGPSKGRGQVLRGIMSTGLRVCDIRDTTPVPTPGCRPKAARRL